MSPRIRQYLFGAIFFAVGAYYLYKKDFLEGALYCLAGISFVINTLAGEPKLIEYKKTLAIAAWICIIATAILFLWVVQFKYL